MVKYQFYKDKVQFLEFFILTQGTKMEENKIKTIKD